MRKVRIRREGDKPALVRDLERKTGLNWATIRFYEKCAPQDHMKKTVGRTFLFLPAGSPNTTAYMHKDKNQESCVSLKFAIVIRD